MEDIASLRLFSGPGLGRNGNFYLLFGKGSAAERSECNNSSRLTDSYRRHSLLFHQEKETHFGTSNCRSNPYSLQPLNLLATHLRKKADSQPKSLFLGSVEK